jgi:Zn-finger nucleic acid-binding protein
MAFDHHKVVFSCEYCTWIYYPEETQDGIRATDIEENLECPLCHNPLVLAYVGKIKVSTCSRCRGILIEQPTFLRVIQYMRSKVKEPLLSPPPVRMEEVERKLHCPSCHMLMDTHPYAGPGNIIIDNCPRCNLNWMDHNELYRVTHTADGLPRGQYFDLDPDRLFKRKKRH